MIRKTFDEKGLEYVSQLVIENLLDLCKVIQWNADNDIQVYRMSSDLFPWMSEYKFKELPNYQFIKELCEIIGDFAKEKDIRLSFHPGQFDVLASPNPSVVDKTIHDLDQHARIMDLMGLPKSHYAAINIHIGGSYGDKESALARFCENFKRLAPSTRARLVVENDDKQKQYAVEDLMFIHKRIGIPITFDYFHHSHHPGSLTEQEALNMAATTWPQGITQAVHYSESKRLHENNPKQNARAHSDMINSIPETYGLTIDVMTECKSKDLAILPYLPLKS
jgi:UV DNA damage endonuclease